MKVLGVIGGIAPESTIVYYRTIIAEYRRRVPDDSQPPVIINSIDMMKMLGLIGAGKFADVTDYLLVESQRLVKAGAEFAIYASNTPHVVFHELQRRSSIPLLSIAECAAAEANRLGLRKPALFGTRFTMQADFYPEVFSRNGLTLTLPLPDEQGMIHDTYMNELVKAEFKDRSRQKLLEIIDRMITIERIDGVVLGGTELPLLFRMEQYKGLPLLDTSLLHARAAVEEMLRD